MRQALAALSLLVFSGCSQRGARHLETSAQRDAAVAHADMRSDSGEVCVHGPARIDGGMGEKEYCFKRCANDSACPTGQVCVCSEPGCSISQVTGERVTGLSDHYCAPK